jgi:hypothetical protein
MVEETKQVVPGLKLGLALGKEKLAVASAPLDE